MKYLITVVMIVVFFSVNCQIPPAQSPPNQTGPNQPPTPDYTIKPHGNIWPSTFKDREARKILGRWLLSGNWNNDLRTARTSYEYEGYDGWNNNFARPDSGAIDGILLRRWPAAYEDGTYLPSGFDRPNPLNLSEKLLSGPIGTKSKTGKNALLVFFGQQVVEEILDAQRPACPPEYINIDIPENHPYRKIPGHTELPVLRTRYNQNTGLSPSNPRQQINEITPYLDGGLFYGITKQWADQLRTYKNGTVDPDGRLAYSHDGLFPEYNTDRLPMANPPPPFYHSIYTSRHELARVSRFFKLGNPRGNENAFLLTFGVMWFRWHNYLAEILRSYHPSWNSEQIFNEARKWVIATQQHIIVDEWLPAWVEPLGKYNKYDPSINPQIDQFFQSAAFRFGHTLVVPGVYLRDYKRNGCTTNFTTWGKAAVRTCNIFWRPQEPMLNKTSSDVDELIDIDRLLMGMATQLSEREDHHIVEDLRGNVFGPLEFPRRDLMAINIQRGRDHGLPDYNSARKAYGLNPVDFEYFGKFNQSVVDILKEMYKNVNKIDPWIGGILETTDGPGELFKTVILDQFRRIRDGDRFWYENRENGLFTKAEVRRIKEINLYDIIMAVTKMDHDDIPQNPFRAPTLNIPNCNLQNTTGTCFNSKATCTYYHLPQLNEEILKEPCLAGGSYDYFSNSAASYVWTFIGIGTFILANVGLIFVLFRIANKKNLELMKSRDANTRKTMETSTKMYPLFIVDEWVGPKTKRRISVLFKDDLHKIEIMGNNNQKAVLRALDFPPHKGELTVRIYWCSDEKIIVTKTPHNYDLVLIFETDTQMGYFLNDLKNFFSSINWNFEKIDNEHWKDIMKFVITKEIRQKRLEMFFRVVFAQAFKIKHSSEEILNVDARLAKDVVDTELTISEFAEALTMRPNDEFVKKIFSLVDKDGNGFISFREFVDLLIIFANGTEEEKLKLLFKMYDINGTDSLTPKEFVAMIKSFLETVGGRVEDERLVETVQSMMRKAGVDHKEELHFEDFKKIIGNDIKTLNKAKLGFGGVKKEDRHSYLETAKDTIEHIYLGHNELRERFDGNVKDNDERTIDNQQAQYIEQQSKIQGNIQQGKFEIIGWMEVKYKQIFWMGLYTLVLIAIFAERAYYYSVEREHSGLRTIAGYGVTITRGAASAMMFTYSSLLVTMCRNLITFLRETVANRYFPFDASVEIHKYIAAWAFVFTVLHIVGHAFNFYHISTQTADDLTCLFRNYFHATHELPKFHYWCWQTMTGITGIILTLIWIVMYIFATSFVRKRLYNWFWYTHGLYPFFFIFMILHGTGRLIQPPFTYYFLLGPVILFAMDTLVSISRKKIEIPVTKAEVLPSNVTMLQFTKPENFQYRAGQWVRVASLALNENEYHPFTLSSCPEEEFLTVHIRAVGPWTYNIRKIYETSLADSKNLPKIYLDGPFGEGHQDWDLHDVSVLIGGGIGVTPFASILKNIAYKTSKNKCKRVYFIWISRTQKQFEWFVDIIREVEGHDKNLISCHIFITQFYAKYDLRTILLYICEKHYQKVCQTSLLTNLRAVTHFGRPSFPNFFATVQSLHVNAKSIGVFSCGPPSMTSSVDIACNQINAQGGQRFEHHYKNF